MELYRTVPNCTEPYRTVPNRPRPSGSDRSEFHTIKSANVLPKVSVSFPGLSWSMRMPSTVQLSGMRVGSQSRSNRYPVTVQPFGSRRDAPAYL